MLKRSSVRFWAAKNKEVRGRFGGKPGRRGERAPQRNRFWSSSNWSPRKRACTDAVHFLPSSWPERRRNSAALAEADFRPAKEAGLSWIVENDAVDEQIRRGKLKARGDLHLAGKFKTASLCSPRFSFCRVIRAGVALKVTLATGSLISDQKKLPRRVRRFCKYLCADASFAAGQMLAGKGGIGESEGIALTKIAVQLIQGGRAKTLVDRSAEGDAARKTVHDGNAGTEGVFGAIGKCQVGASRRARAACDPENQCCYSRCRHGRQR